MIYKCKHFGLQELLSKAVYEDNIAKYGNNLWFIFDAAMLITLDRLRERYGKTNMNNWQWGGQDDSRGYRSPEDPEGAKLSQHRRGTAADPWFEQLSADEVREDLEKNPRRPTFKHITCIEDGAIAKTWFHFDTRNWDRSKSGILIVKPMNR